MDWNQADQLLEGLERLTRRFQLETKVIRWNAEARGAPIPDTTLQELEGVFHLVERVNARAARLVRAIVKGAQRREQWWEEEMDKRQDQLEDVLTTVASDRIEDGFNPRGYFVYCLWGQDATRPFYVGRSINVLSRLGQHTLNPILAPQIRHITLVRCKDRLQMDRTEAHLISRYQPPENTYGIRETPSERDIRQAGTARGLARAMEEIFRDELAEEERLRQEDRNYFRALEPSGTSPSVDNGATSS